MRRAATPFAPLVGVGGGAALRIEGRWSVTLDARVTAQWVSVDGNPRRTTGVSLQAGLTWDCWRLSAAPRGGIDEGMNSPTRSSIMVLAVALTLAGGCEVRPLRSADLYGAAGTGAPAGAAGSAGTVAGTAGSAAGAGGLGAAAGSGGAGGLAGSAGSVAGAGGPAAGGQPAADGTMTKGRLTERRTRPSPTAVPTRRRLPAHRPALPIDSDELTNQCVPRTGTGMLSGMVVDACSGRPRRAIGIAGQRCAPPGQGLVLLSALPLGRLKLAAVKDGYVRRHRRDRPRRRRPRNPCPRRRMRRAPPVPGAPARSRAALR